jgi:hypothetical protein
MPRRNPRPLKPAAADPALVARAQLPRGRPGRLSRGNTRPGTRERQAVDRAAYLRRRGDLGEGETVRSRLGHGPADRAMPALFGTPPRWVDLDNLSRAESRRLGRYWSLVSITFEVGDRRLSRAEAAERERRFERRVSSWRPLRGGRLLADPRAVAVLLAERSASDVPTVFYRRAGRR